MSNFGLRQILPSRPRTTQDNSSESGTTKKIYKIVIGYHLRFCGFDSEYKSCDDIAGSFIGHKLNCREASEREYTVTQIAVPPIVRSGTPHAFNSAGRH